MANNRNQQPSKKPEKQASDPLAAAAAPPRERMSSATLVALIGAAAVIVAAVIAGAFQLVSTRSTGSIPSGAIRLTQFAVDSERSFFKEPGPGAFFDAPPVPTRSFEADQARAGYDGGDRSAQDPVFSILFTNAGTGPATLSRLGVLVYTAVPEQGSAEGNYVFPGAAVVPVISEYDVDLSEYSFDPESFGQWSFQELVPPARVEGGGSLRIRVRLIRRPPYFE